MTFALDTNPCIEILRARTTTVLARYRATDPQRIVLPSIVAAELLVGAEKSARPDAKAKVEAFLSAHSILPFGESEMRAYASLRSRLEALGQRMSDNDLIVAATVLPSGATLVTHNVREFSRVDGLRLIDWQV